MILKLEIIILALVLLEVNCKLSYNVKKKQVRSVYDPIMSLKRRSSSQCMRFYEINSK